MTTNVVITGTGIVIPASFGLSVVSDPEGKNIQKRSLAASSTVQMNISLYMFLAQFLVEKNNLRALGF